MNNSLENVDKAVVKAFGEEWTHFDQHALEAEDRARIFDEYFAIFPWERVNPEEAEGADIGCGSGRWALQLAPKVKTLHCVDASLAALEVAKRNLVKVDNVIFHLSSVANLPFADASLDFAVSLGVLHHVPDTAEAIRSVAATLKIGAPFLIYLYYAFDNRPPWFRLIWRMTDGLRIVVSRLPFPLRRLLSQVLAFVVYWPLATTAKLLHSMQCLPANWPLAYYRDKPFYVMRTDALDRFGTRLEQRFTRKQVSEMLKGAGFTDICFSDKPPYWCAVGIRG